MPESGFTDINGNTFEEDIECLAWYEITEGGPAGLPATQYGPFLDVRRDQMASFIARTIDYVDPTLLAPYDGTNEFVDVASTNVHLAAINRLAAANVVLGGPGGRPANQFGPDLPISRAQMASFINRAYGVVNGGAELTSGTDYFDDDNTSVHEDNINALAGAGIVQGRAFGVYAPLDSVRRDAMSAFIMRLMDLFVEQGDATPPSGPTAEVTITSTTVDAGGTVTGTITGEGLESATVSGCGLTNAVVTDTDTGTAGIQFSLDIPAGQAAGTCTLTFTSTFDDGQTATDTVTVTVEVNQATITVTPTTVRAGDTVTGTITGEGLVSARVTGCGLDTNVTDTDAGTDGIQFTLTIPADQAAGACTLTFTSTFDEGADVVGNVDITVQANDAIVTVDATTVPAGNDVTGTITGEGLVSATVSGCGLADDTVVTDTDAGTDGIQFSLPIPAGQAAGTCTLTFTTTFAEGGPDEDTTDITVELPAQSFTAAPELVNVEIVESDVLAFSFDETVTGQALKFTDLGAGNRAYFSFRLYNPNGAVSYPFQASIQDDRVLARFTADQITTASRAGVRYDAVEDVQGIPNIEGEFALQPAAVIPPATEPFSPQLIEVGNYRLAPVIIGGTQRVLVDFVFNDPDAVTALQLGDGLAGANAEEFYLVGNDSAEFQGLNIFAVQTTATQATVTVELAANPSEVPESELSRGYVVANDDDAIAEDGDGLVLAEGYQALAGNTVDPDLVSVQRVDATTYRFEFDEAVSDAALVSTSFFVFDSNGVRTQATGVVRSARVEDQARVVVATFPALPATGAGTPVDAFVTDAAVRATDSTASQTLGFNRPDEEVITLPAPEDPTVLPAGVTALPDLLSVTRGQNVVTGNRSVTYTFDQDVTGDVDGDLVSDEAQVDFDLYDANGTQFRVSGIVCGTTPGVTCSADGTSVTFSIDAGFAQFSNEQIAAAVAAGVQDTTDFNEPQPVVTEAEVQLEG